ncbi:DUF1648 domain-containing protein [Streptococcus catagoni]|uniref:DUF1648 domain-containing protein n=1 Tax=Streptococcus catagoni TaxID=2654874 RepID=UPI00140D5759|nr:DUF1648 domain-containing protein [Streptococcus catagoni]
MKKLKLFIRSVELLILAITITLFIIAPNTIIVHFNSSGLPDGYGNKISLYVFSLITIIVGELGIAYFKYQRKKTGMEDSPMLNWQEIRFFQILAMVALAFLVAMIYQLFYLKR